MKKKQRHNPNKKQNNYNNHCPYDDGNCCELLLDSEIIKICKSNPHNCRSAMIKAAYSNPNIKKILDNDYEIKNIV